MPPIDADSDAYEASGGGRGVMRGFALRWDVEDLVKAIEPRRIVWTDPTDWMGAVQPVGPRYSYRPMDGPDEPYLEALMR